MILGVLKNEHGGLVHEEDAQHFFALSNETPSFKRFSFTSVTA